ncbi:MAG: hypothetical protein EBR82_00640 [Caulobacteraceae bacterium]|nr:hypothetical protein [Caulobacteraceae bacterium]
MRIAHTADIHIRALSRHDEYRETFQDFIDDCRSQRVDHIFVGGDIFHTKTTGISPEYIDLLTWWLKSMAEVAPVHLILGNHDGNLVNASRQDAVSPIVDALGDDRIKLYKKSGAYELQPGYSLCVFSIFDEDGWKDVSPVDGSVNIAAYHGPVWGSQTETDWLVEDGMRTGFFDKYDFTLLGDIHKRQDLLLRDGRPVMCYPGTLIQQNYAEELVHGYLIWDIQSSLDWNVEFRKLKNRKPYVTIDWSGSVDDTFTAAKRYPKGSRFRFRFHEHVTQDDVHLLSEKVKTALHATEVTYKSDAPPESRVSLLDSDSEDFAEDIRSPDAIVKLIKEHHSEKEISDEDLQIITSQVKTCLSAASTGEEVTRGAKWTLNHMKWDNVFVYGEDNTIDFDKLKGIVGIFGPNRIGKSSVVGTIMYSLFNTTDRGPMKNLHVCNMRKPYCSSKVIITHNGTPYVIERQTTKSTNRRGVTSASTDLNLYRIREDGEFEDMCGEQRNDTEKTIRNLIGSADDFLLTSLSAQGDANAFISQGSSKRRQVLTRFLDLDVFDRMHDVASKDLNLLKGQLRNFPERDWSTLEKGNKTELASLTDLLDRINSVFEENQSRLTMLRSEMSTHNAKPVTQHDVEVQEERVSTLEKKSEDCTELIANLTAEKNDLETKLDAIETVISRYDVTALKRKQDAQRTLEKAIVELRHSADRELTTLTQQKKSLKILDEVPCGDDYPTCKFIKDAHGIKLKLSQQEQAVTRAQDALKEAETAAVAAKDDTIDDKLSKHAKASDLAAKLRLEISRKETELERQRSTCDSCGSSLDEAKKTLVALKSALNEKESKIVSRIRIEMDEISRKLKALEEKKITAIDSRSKLKAMIDNLRVEKERRDELLAKMRVQELVSTAFSKKGIPMLITKTQLPRINAEVSKVLQGIVDFTIELENDEESDALEIYINYGDSKRVVELCSGMEKTIASIALRAAMTNITTLPKPDIFIIDEGFGTLDNAGVESCNRLLASLKNQFKTVVVITHVDGIKDAADHIIEITRNEKDSRVEIA